MAVFTHVTVGTNDLTEAREFYDAVLAPLGVKRLKDFGENGSCDRGAKDEGARLVRALSGRTPMPVTAAISMATNSPSTVARPSNTNLI